MLLAEKEAPVRQELYERLIEARRRTDELFGIVRAQSLYERPIPERHRIIFYIGHLEAFDWNLLSERVFALSSFHSDFDKLFAFGIDPVGGGLPDDQPSDWPAIEQVRTYVSEIRQRLDDALDKAGADSESREFPLRQLLNVAIEHRLMHAETLAYMLHQLPFDRKIVPAAKPIPTTASVAPGMVEIPAGSATLGLSRQKDVFGWDNEFEQHVVNVPEFAIDQYEVTNREYLDFLRAGGYQAREFWDDDDWNWKAANRISQPVFWKQTADGWLYRGMFEEMPLPLDAPVYVSQAEAKAYANWARKSLPTEAEWHRAAYGDLSGTERAYPWGDAAPTANRGNFDFAYWDPTPVNAFPEGNSAFGVADLMGNGWEWTSTPFGPFAGFEPFPFYPGYSANFSDNKHFVMKGGSARTAACMLRRSFRNWFQSHYQYVYAGFRCVRR
ncbi:MAG TPA: SUMF1/EgtB/PvdO family nonheme iron enzyme [Candidatus Sulfotelmatobacter sp.]|nr:SUMF1/EgtB/PvdO family nonheme iron enzyme [Candidatus Sulfotelmatobacter sp.]